jgi:UDP-N-acetylglucosamine 4,6-dehydratase
MQGGEVFVPKIPSTRIVDLARAIAPEATLDVIGIRAGEKLHEVLINDDESRSTIELADMFVVQPSEALWFGHAWQEKGSQLPNGFRYASETNTRWLSVEEMQSLISEFEAAQDGKAFNLLVEG